METPCDDITMKKKILFTPMIYDLFVKLNLSRGIKEEQTRRKKTEKYLATFILGNLTTK